MDGTPAKAGSPAGFEVRVSASGFPIFCKPAEPKWVAPAAGGAGAAAAADEKGRIKTRLTKAHGDRVGGGVGKVGSPFPLAPNPSWIKDRAAVYDEIIAAQKARLASKPRVPIKVTLPDGKVIDGVSWETTPLQIAEGISKGLAGSAVVARVTYISRIGLEEADGANVVNTGPEEEEEAGAGAAAAKPELWDLPRPLEGDCKLELLKFDDKDGKMVFWHSSAHVLGECLECQFGGQLCIGPPTEEGFYYDAYMGEQCVTRIIRSRQWRQA